MTRGGVRVNPNLHFTLVFFLFNQVMEMYQPTALVLQCGADSLAGDRLGTKTLILHPHACVCVCVCVYLYPHIYIPIYSSGTNCIYIYMCSAAQTRVKGALCA